MAQKLKKEWGAFRILLREVPPLVFAFFILSVFSMNLLANKSISLSVPWLALDCGIVVSWFAFLAMDMITRHFGPKAANELSLLAVVVNLALCLIFFLSSVIPGVWAQAYTPGEEQLINAALDRTFGGTWYVLLGSTLAFTVSAFVNNFCNWGVGCLLHKNVNGFGAYALRSYVSTAVGQLTDNLVFALTVSRIFFGWSYLQCFTCALTGMCAELLCEVLFSPLGFRLCRSWEKRGVGEAYFRRLEQIGEERK